MRPSSERGRSLSFYHQLERSWRDERPALLTSAGPVTFADLRVRVARARGWIAGQGLRAGDVLALQLPKGQDLLDLHLAALSLGVATLPINDRYTAEDVRYVLHDSHARLAVLALDVATRLDGPILPAPRVPAASPIEAGHPADDAPALIAYTSGTTGRPKGAVLTHANLAATVGALHAAWRWTSDDVLVHALPLHHIHGLIVAQHGALWA